MTPEEQEQLDALTRKQQVEREARQRADREAADKEEKRREFVRINRFYVALRGVGTHSTGSEHDVDVLVEKFVEDLKALGYEIHHAEFGGGEPGQEKKKTFHET